MGKVGQTLPGGPDLWPSRDPRQRRKQRFTAMLYDDQVQRLDDFVDRYTREVGPLSRTALLRLALDAYLHSTAARLPPSAARDPDRPLVQASFELFSDQIDSLDHSAARGGPDGPKRSAFIRQAIDSALEAGLDGLLA